MPAASEALSLDRFPGSAYLGLDRVVHWGHADEARHIARRLALRVVPIRAALKIHCRHHSGGQAKGRCGASGKCNTVLTCATGQVVPRLQRFGYCLGSWARPQPAEIGLRGKKSTRMHTCARDAAFEPDERMAGVRPSHHGPRVVAHNVVRPTGGEEQVDPTKAILGSQLQQPINARLETLGPSVREERRGGRKGRGRWPKIQAPACRRARVAPWAGRGIDRD
jgi:hypothetical protein